MAKRWEDVTVAEMTKFITEYLPDRWLLELTFGVGVASVDLESPQEQYADVGTDDLEGDVAEMVQRCVAHARGRERLPAVSLLESGAVPQSGG